MHIILAIVGLIAGSILGRHGSWLYGMLAGFAIGAWIIANHKIKKLQEELFTLKKHVYVDKQSTSKETATTVEEHKEEPQPTEAISTAREVVDTPAEQPVIEEKQPEPKPVETPAWGKPESTPVNDTPAYIQAEPLPIDKAIAWLKEFFTTGNIMVKVGVTVLFFGIAFLVKYAAERAVFPIELRLAGIGIAGIVMLVLGWRLRDKKSAYALVMQGGALAVLYLTVFSALRLYDLIPPTFAFVILFIFSSFSAALAVLQNSRALAVLALSGGFLAPILTSSGSGNYIGLFSYYLVLNLGVFGITWFKSWRLLNLLGFLFTFVVATAWGLKSYTHDDFVPSELFLIAFYLLYVAISVLFAIRQPVQLKGYVDSTLVFGVPIVGFGLQAGMVNHIEYALAWSSIVLSAFYIGLASILWQRLTTEFRLICEAFLAIGVIFATLAIPFALDATWTSGAWALEGAAAVWVGIRQSRLLPRLLGYLLQLASAYTFFDSYSYYSQDDLFILNGHYIGAMIIAISGIFIAWQNRQLDIETLSDKLPIFKEEPRLSVPFLAWGLVWWTAAGIHEIHHGLHYKYEAFALLLFASLSAFSMQALKNKLSWEQLRLPALLLLPALYLLFPFVLLENRHPFGDWNLVSWIIALSTHLWIIKHYDDAETRYTRLLHAAGFWLLIIILTTEIAWQVDRHLVASDTWTLIMTGLVPVTLMMLLYLYGQRIAWPVNQHQHTYQVFAIKPVAFMTWAWFIMMNIFSEGNSRPIPYLPLLNPLDIVLALQLLALTYWQRIPASIEDWAEKRWRFDQSKLLLALSIFLWLNTMWLRLAHHIWGIDFDLSDMTRSRVVQTGIAILWSVTGLSCMIMGARKMARSIWIAGAIVMAAVVVKLFMFDLANTGTVERIVSFISVGILLLVVGYFAPVPPAQESSQKEMVDEK